jgi:hypothetical protein
VEKSKPMLILPRAENLVLFRPLDGEMVSRRIKSWPLVAYVTAVVCQVFIRTEKCNRFMVILIKYLLVITECHCMLLSSALIQLKKLNMGTAGIFSHFFYWLHKSWKDVFII